MSISPNAPREEMLAEIARLRKINENQRETIQSLTVMTAEAKLRRESEAFETVCTAIILNIRARISTVDKRIRPLVKERQSSVAYRIMRAESDVLNSIQSEIGDLRETKKAQTAKLVREMKA